MSYNSGTLSFTRYTLRSDTPQSIDPQVLLEKAAKHQFVEHDLGVPEENSYGWVGPQHIMDGDFTFENCVYGDFLILGIRQDICRLPGEVKRAYQLMEEKAAAANNPSGFISKLQKREAREAVKRKIDQDLRDGKHRKSKLAHVIWDVAEQVVYAPSGKGSQQIVGEIFERTFGFTLVPITPGSIGETVMAEKGKLKSYEDWKPTPFVDPNAVGVMWADYPWVAKSGVQNYIGNEFLMMLLFQSVAGGDFNVGSKVIDVEFRESLDIECAFGATGKDSLKDANPVGMAEALPALRTGKVPRKAGLMLTEGTETYFFTLTGDTFAVNALKLPAVEDAETVRELIEERLMLLRGFSRAFDGLFQAFVEHRATKWDDTAAKIKHWLGGSTARPVTADSKPAGAKAAKTDATNFSRAEIETILKAGQTTKRMLEIRDLVHRIYADTYVRYFHMLRGMIRGEMGKDGSPLSGALKLMKSGKWAAKVKEMPLLTLFFVASAVDMIEPKDTTPPEDAGQMKVTKGMAKAMKQLAGNGGLRSVSMTFIGDDGKEEEGFTIDDSNRKQMIDNCNAIIEGKAEFTIPAGDPVFNTVMAAATAVGGQPTGEPTVVVDATAEEQIQAGKPVAWQSKAPPPADEVRESDRQEVFQCTAGRLDVAPRRNGTWCYRWQIKLGDISETSDWTGIEHKSLDAVAAGCESLRKELRTKQDLDDTGKTRKRQLEAHLRGEEQKIKAARAAA